MGAAVPCCKNSLDSSESRPESLSTGKERAAEAVLAATPVVAPPARSPEKEVPSLAVIPETVDQNPPQDSATENNKVVAAEAAPEAVPEAAPEATPEAAPEAAPAAVPEAAPEASPEAPVDSNQAAVTTDEATKQAEQEQVIPSRPEDPTVGPLRPSDAVTMRGNNVLKDFYDAKSVAAALGAYGMVHKATTLTKPKKPRAVKCIPFSSFNPEDFEREFNVAKLLEHPNIAYLYDAITDSLHEKSWYLISDLYTGGDLFEALTNKGQTPGCIPDTLLARYAREMLEGLKYMHYHYYCHRDVKTENYMLESPGDQSTLKLIDFGTSCAFTPGTPMTLVCGTMGHASPELLNESYDEKVDIWAVGVCLYFLSICRLPFAVTTDNDNQLKEMIKQGPDLSYSLNRDTVSWRKCTEKSSDGTNAVGLTAKMLTLDPKARPTARALLEGDDEYLKKAAKSGGAAKVKKGFFSRK